MARKEKPEVIAAETSEQLIVHSFRLKVASLTENGG